MIQAPSVQKSNWLTSRRQTSNGSIAIDDGTYFLSCEGCVSSLVVVVKQHREFVAGRKASLCRLSAGERWTRPINLEERSMALT